MQLSNLIKSFFYNKKYNFYNEDTKVNKDQVFFEYQKIYFYLRSNLNKGDVLAIYMSQSYKYVLVILAAFELGIIIIPLSSNWPLERLKQILGISKVDLLLTDDIYLSNLTCNTSSINKIICSTSQCFCTRKYFSDKINSLSEDILYIIYTSGSMGMPKGVVIKRKSYSNFVKWAGKYFHNIKSEDKILNTADFSFDLSMLDIALLLTKSPHFYISSSKKNFFKTACEIGKYKITTIAAVPNLFQLLLSETIMNNVDLDCLKNLLIGGARFSYGLYQKISALKGHKNIYNLYGPTEATVYCSAHKLSLKEEEDIYRYNVSIGKTIDNTDFLIVDDFGNKVSTYQEGNLYIGGVQVMKEYINDKIKSKEVLSKIDGNLYYFSGDRAYRDNLEKNFIVGRVDDTIKKSGYRVNLQDIDSYIQKIPYIEEVSTIAIPNELSENIVISYIRSRKITCKQTVFDELDRIIPKHQIPDLIEFIDTFKLNNSGKICKKQLVKKYLAENSIKG